MEFGLRALMEQVPVPTLRPKDASPHTNLNPTPVEQDLGPHGPPIGVVNDREFYTGNWDVRSQPYPSESQKGTIGPEYIGSQFFTPEIMKVPAARPKPEDYADTSLTHKDLYGPSENGKEPFFPHRQITKVLFLSLDLCLKKTFPIFQNKDRWFRLVRQEE